MSEKPLPGHAEQPPEITCASCGRFVGALPRCPYCGARVNARLSIRFFRYAALFLGIVGLFLLYLMARSREVPLIKIGEIKATMNFAYVRVAGQVTGAPRVNWEGEHVRSVRFLVNDDTGEIPVMAFGTKGQRLVDQDRVPRSGDRVEVAGSLSVSADNLAIWLQAPDRVILQRAEVPATALAEIHPELAGSTIQVEGSLVQLTPPRAGSKAPWTIRLRDDTGEQDIVFWSSEQEEIQQKVNLQPGARLRIRAAVGTYQDTLQLSLAGASDIEAVEAGAAPAKPEATRMTQPAAPTVSPAGSVVQLGDIQSEMEGRLVVVEGLVDEIRPPANDRAPHKIVLSDGQHQIVLVYWDDVAEQMKQDAPRHGQRLRVNGRVGVFRDELQLKVEKPEQIIRMDASSKTPAEKTSG